jgi:transposase
MLVEAAWQAVRGPGPLRAFYQRIARRRGNHIAAVAVARKLAVIIWHLLKRGEDYAWVRPALHAKKLRDLELRSGQPARRGQRGMAYKYNLSRIRLEERRRAEQAETAYKRQTEAWTRARKTGAHRRRKGGATLPSSAAKAARWQRSTVCRSWCRTKRAQSRRL